MIETTLLRVNRSTGHASVAIYRDQPASEGTWFVHCEMLAEEYALPYVEVDAICGRLLGLDEDAAP